MKNIKTDKDIIWYIVNNESHGSLTRTKKGVHYNEDLNTPETFDNLEDYESRCKELGIELEEIKI